MVRRGRRGGGNSVKPCCHVCGTPSNACNHNCWDCRDCRRCHWRCPRRFNGMGCTCVCTWDKRFEFVSLCRQTSDYIDQKRGLDLGKNTGTAGGRQRRLPLLRGAVRKVTVVALAAERGPPIWARAGLVEVRVEDHLFYSVREWASLSSHARVLHHLPVLHCDIRAVDRHVPQHALRSPRRSRPSRGIRVKRGEGLPPRPLQVVRVLAAVPKAA
mmetsp:Transcript_43704/g.86204  ORF Transcript_43704/g.86204 Transcript_43704/m.86204 type:complete len:214 (+) Transcript_43704:446-1087(+)